MRCLWSSYQEANNVVAGLQIRVGICDDHPIVRSGFASLIASHSDLKVVAEAATAREAEALARSGACDVLLLDIALPEGSGIDALRNITLREGAPSVIILSGFPEEQYAIQTLKMGAKGYLSKDAEPDEVVRAVRMVGAGRRYVSESVGDLLASGVSANDPATDKPHMRLSDRELQVFLRLANGEAVGQIAKSLNLSPKTVSTYRSRVLETLALDSNSALTRYALQHRLIQ